jgi:hypothetical protein
MTSYLRHWIAASLVIIALGQSTFADDDLRAPRVPPAIQVPAGNTPFLVGQAVGTQNYVCLPSASGFSWTLFGPQATLFFTFKTSNSEIQQQITTHFLSANPDENEMPRPTWQSSFDTSAVWGRSIASSMDSNFVAPGAIPWLLLQVVGTERGPAGGDFLTQTTFIHRLNTSGGVAPSTGCSQSTNVGATTLVRYTADYFFYRYRASR